MNEFEKPDDSLIPQMEQSKQIADLAQERAQINEEKYQQLADNITDMFFAMDKELRHTYWNRACEQFTGISSKDALGKSLFDVFEPHQHLQRIEREYKEVLKTRQAKRFICEFTQKNTLFFLDINVYPTAEGISVLAKNITEQKKSEELELKFNLLFEKAGVGAAQIDAWTGRFVHINQKYADMLGYTIEEMLNIDFRTITNSEYLEQTLLNLNLLHKGEISDFSMEKGYTHKKGHDVWVKFQVSPLWEKDEKPNYYLAIVTDITEQKQTEEKLASQTELLERTGEMAQVGGWELDLETFNVTFSKETARIHEVGYPYVPPHLSQGNEYYPPEAWPIIQDAVQKAIEFGTEYDLESPFITAKGKRIWVRVQGFRVMKDGKPSKLRGTFQDITKRKLAEQELIKAKEKAEESEKRLKLASASGKLGIWDLDIVENNLIWDDKMFELYGISRNTFSSNLEAWTNGLHPEDKDMAFREFSLALKGEKTFDTTFRVLHPNGNVVYIKADAIVIKDAKGNASRMIGINKDVTESRKAEIELNKAKEKAEESQRNLQIKNAEYEALNEELLSSEEDLKQNLAELNTNRENLERTIAEMFRVKQELKARLKILDKVTLITESDQYGTITYVNDNFCKVSKYSAEEVIGKPHNIIRHPDNPRSLFKEMWDTIKNGKIFFGEIKNRAKDGSTYWVRTAIAPIMDAEGNPHKYLAIRFDITERKNMEEQILQINENLEETVQLRTEELQKSEANLQVEKANLEHANKNIRKSIMYAKRIQSVILPDRLSMNEFFKDLFVHYLPRDIVSGDLYWFSNQGEKTIVSVIDCTGHGVPGAFMSLIAYTLLNELVHKQGIVEPAQILSELNEEVKYALKQEKSTVQDGMDIAICVIDKKARELQYAGAKIPLLIVENGQATLVKGSRKHVGGTYYGKKEDFVSNSIPLTDNQCFYMYTDGFQDQFGGEHHRKFSSQKLVELITENAHLPMIQQLDVIDQAFGRWIGSETRLDDVLVMGFRVF